MSYHATWTIQHYGPSDGRLQTTNVQGPQTEEHWSMRYYKHRLDTNKNYSILIVLKAKALNWKHI